MVWFLLIGQSLISATGLLTLRYFMPQFLEKLFSSPPNVWAGMFVGAILYGVSFLTWLFILGRYQVSFAYPVTVGITLAITVIGAIVMFKESVTLPQILGMILLVVAIYLVGSNATLNK